MQHTHTGYRRNLCKFLWFYTVDNASANYMRCLFILCSLITIQTSLVPAAAARTKVKRIFWVTILISINSETKKMPHNLECMCHEKLRAFRSEFNYSKRSKADNRPHLASVQCASYFQLTRLELTFNVELESRSPIEPPKAT